MDADELGDLGQDTALVFFEVVNVDPIKLEADQSLELVVADKLEEVT